MKTNLRKKAEVFLSVAVALGIFSPASFAAQPSQFNSRGPGGGGALFAPSFNPNNPGEMYLACDLSAVFHTTNYGVNWNLVDFRQLQGSRPTLMQFTSNPLVVYSIDLTTDAMTPTKSVDGGVTWHQLAGDPTGGGAYFLFADPNGTNRLLVSDYGTLYFSTNGGSSFLPKFTNDPSGSGCFVAGAFFDATNIYVGCTAGLLVSSNGGGTFALANVGGITPPQVMLSFSGAKQGGTTRFFCVTANSGDVFPGLLTEDTYNSGSYLGTYSLDWGQANWTLRTNGIQSGDLLAFVATSLTDISTAYVAGQISSEFPAIYKTINGGASWQRTLLPTNNQNVFTGWAGNGGDRDWSYGAGALGLVVAPNDSSKVCYTDLGFAHISTNGGAFWKQMYVNPADQNPTNALITKGRSYHGVGLEDTSCWTMAWADSNHVVAGYSDIKGAISADAGNSWSFGYTGDNFNSMYCCFKHPVSGVLYAAVSSTHDMYQSTHLKDSTIDGGTGAILYSVNQGVTWQTLHTTTNIAMWVAPDPNNTNRLYATVAHSANGGVYVLSNIGSGATATFSKLAAPAGTEGHAFNIKVLNDGTLVCTYSGRINSSSAFTKSSGVFVSLDSGASWINRSHTNMTYWTKDLVVDPNDPAQNTWYVGVFSGFGGPPNGLGGLYKTTNRGVSWTRLNSLDRVESCAINPLNTNELYLTTEVEGLWLSTNINAVTPTFTQMAVYPFRQPERIFFNPFNSSEMWVTSFGHGMRVGSTLAGSLPGTLSVNASTLTQNGTVALTLQQATPNAAYAIQASTTLSNWVSVGTNTAGTNGVLQFNDTNAGSFRERFYRGKAQ